MNRRVVYILPGTFILVLLVMDVLGGSCSRAHWTVARLSPEATPRLKGDRPATLVEVPQLQTGPVPGAPEKIAVPSLALPGSSPNASEQASPSGGVRGIRGVDADGLIAGLQGVGLRCSTPSIHSDELVWVCRRRSEGAEFSVVLVAPATDAPPFSVSATVRQVESDPSDLKAGLWLGGIATLPYEDASPLVAREWVIAHVASGGETHFGGARLRLSGSPGARTLDIVAVGTH